MTDEVLLNEYLAESNRTLSTCDAYDVKASIWLVVIIFLATQTAYLLGKSLPTYLWWGQFMSAILLVMSGVVTLVELYPRDYKHYSPSNGVLERWLAAMRAAHKGEDDAESLISRKATAYKLLWVKQMIVVNKGFNEKKSRLLMFSFRTAAAATTINIVTLAIIPLVSRSR